MILVIGGARSGKSTFAEKKASALKDVYRTNVMYIATAIGFDAEMKDRIKKHRSSRDNSWETLEKYKKFEKEDVSEKCEVILLDCLTLMISNLILETKYDFDRITPREVDDIENLVEKEIKSFLETFRDKEIIIVSNEVGFGLVPEYRLGAIFRDISGRINQLIAREAKEVYLMIAGIEMRIK